MFNWLLGLIMGSFLCLVSERIVCHESILMPRSYCDHCKHPLMARDLIPVVSHLIRNRCRFCNELISWKSTIVEGICGLYWMLYPPTLQSVILACALMILSLIDIKTYTIYDRFNLLILGVSFLSSSFELQRSLIGAISISVPLCVLAYLTNGMGGGDIKLIACIGFLLGSDQTFIVLVIATVTALAYAVIRKNKENPQIPFAPFLSIGCIVVFHHSNELLRLYAYLHPLL